MAREKDERRGSIELDDDSAGGGFEAAADRVEGRAPEGPSRRRLLLAGGAALAAGAGWWAVSRGGGGDDRAERADRGRGADRTDRGGPDDRVDLPGVPVPLWTYRGRRPQQPERLITPLAAPVYCTGSEVVVLDAASGKELRTVVPESGGAGPEPFALQTDGTHLLSVSGGRITAWNTSDPVADWEAPVPTGLVGTGGRPASSRLLACGPGHLVGASELTGGAWPWPQELFGLDLRTRTPSWRLRFDDGVAPVPLLAVPGLLVAHQGEETVGLDTATGRRLWAVPTGEQIGANTADGQRFYVAVPDGTVAAVGLPDGKVQWRAVSTADRDSRCVALYVAGDSLYVCWDSGVVARYAVADGSIVWSTRAPFLLDHRNRPVVAGTALYLPGPRADGVLALGTADAGVRWTYRDRSSGPNPWAVATDGRRLFVGHDDVLHALPLA